MTDTNPIKVYIEGGIASGKSTFVELLKDFIHEFYNQHLDVKLVQEPVDEWMKTCDSDGKNILSKFYGDQDRWAFTFQMNSFISRAHKIQCVIDEIDNNNKHKDPVNRLKPALICERSVYTDRHVFARNCYESGKMTKLEYDVYCKWNDWLSDKFNLRPNAYIYLRCNPNINYERIEKRSRDGEENIPLEYLQNIHKKHDEWMAKEKETIPVFTIDVTEDFTSKKRMTEIFDELYDFISGL